MDIVAMTTRDFLRSKKIPRMIYIRQSIYTFEETEHNFIYLTCLAMHCVLLLALGFRASPAALGFWRRDSGLLIEQLPGQLACCNYRGAIESVTNEKRRDQNII
jgi:hypothetical protein